MLEGLGTGLVGLGFFIVAMGMVIWIDAYLTPFFVSNEYVQYYKIGRIKQFAEEHKIDINKTIAYEEWRKKKSKQRLATWEARFEAEISKDLDPIGDFEDEYKGESKEKKK